MNSANSNDRPGVLVDWCCQLACYSARHHARVLSICGISAIACLLIAASSMSFKTSRTDLVDPTVKTQRDWQQYEAAFGGEMDLIVAVEGPTEARIKLGLDAVAQEIKRNPQLFDKLLYRINADKLVQKGLFQLSLGELDQIRSRVTQFQPLLLGGWSLFNLENSTQAAILQSTLAQASGKLTDGQRAQLIGTADMLESYASYLETGRFTSPFSKDQTGSRMQQIPEYLLARDGTMGILQVAPKRDSSTFTSYEQSIKVLRDIVRRVQSGFPGLTIGITGLPALEHDEMSAAQSASTWSIIISILAVGAICVIGFHRLLHPLYMMLSILLSACWTLGFLTLTVGHLNILSAAFLTTLIGLGIDYSVLWIGRYETLRFGGSAHLLANEQTARTMSPGILGGAITTALAFAMAMTTGFVGLVEMGWIAAGGVIFSLLATLTFLPALLSLTAHQPLASRKPGKQTSPSVAIDVFNHWRTTIVVGIGVLFLGALVLLPRLQIDYNLLHLQQASLPSVQWEHRLLKSMGSSGWYAVSLAKSADDAVARKLAFEKLPTVGRVIELGSILPQQQTEKQPIIQSIGSMLTRLPKPSELPVLGTPDPTRLTTLMQQLAQLKPIADASSEIALGRLRDVADRVNQALKVTLPGERVGKSAVYQQRLLHELISQLNQLKQSADPTPVTKDDLPSNLVERFVGSDGSWLVQVFPKENAWNLEPLKKFSADLAKVDPDITGKPIATLFALQQMMNGYFRAFWLALVVILVATWLDLRSISSTLLAAAPVMIGFTVLLGLLGLFSIPLNPANMIAFPLLLGIGIDYGIHMVHDWRQQLSANGNRTGYQLRPEMVRLLLITGSTTIASFGSMLVASHPGMRSIGLTLAIGVTACLAISLLLLPAVFCMISNRVADDGPQTLTLPNVSPEMLTLPESRAA